MCKSLLKELRFEIGEQYELNEFNLKSLESTFDNGLEYENYEYIKDDLKALLGVELSSNVILQYNGDILARIIYNFDVKYLDDLSNELNKFFPLDKKLNPKKLNLGKTISISHFQKISLILDVQRVIRLTVLQNLG